MIIVFNRLQQTLNNLSHTKVDIKTFQNKTDSISQEKFIYSTRVQKNLELELSTMLKRSDYQLMLHFLKSHPEIKR